MAESKSKKAEGLTYKVRTRGRRGDPQTLVQELRIRLQERDPVAAGNFSVATKMALTILKNEKTTKGSMNLKRLKAA